MPEDELQETVHVGKDGKRTYTVTPTSEDMTDRSHVWTGAEGLIFEDAPPLTEEDRLEANRLWNLMAQPGTSKGKEIPKQGHEKHKKH